MQIDSSENFYPNKFIYLSPLETPLTEDVLMTPPARTVSETNS